MHAPLNVRLSKGLATATLVLATLLFAAARFSGVASAARPAGRGGLSPGRPSSGSSLVRIQTVGGVDRVGGMLAATAATTGVVVSEDGWIVSSAFNFISKPTSILVQLDKARYSARWSLPTACEC